MSTIFPTCFFCQKLLLGNSVVTQRILLGNNWFDFTAFEVTNKSGENLGVLGSTPKQR
jgi:hypothetical protein